MVIDDLVWLKINLSGRVLGKRTLHHRISFSTLLFLLENYALLKSFISVVFNHHIGRINDHLRGLRQNFHWELIGRAVTTV